MNLLWPSLPARLPLHPLGPHFAQTVAISRVWRGGKGWKRTLAKRDLRLWGGGGWIGLSNNPGSQGQPLASRPPPVAASSNLRATALLYRCVITSSRWPVSGTLSYGVPCIQTVTVHAPDLPSSWRDSSPGCTYAHLGKNWWRRLDAVTDSLDIVYGSVGL
jgi:hypothetical protein